MYSDAEFEELLNQDWAGTGFTNPAEEAEENQSTPD